jgi:hypothetical protein
VRLDPAELRVASPCSAGTPRLRIEVVVGGARRKHGTRRGDEVWWRRRLESRGHAEACGGFIGAHRSPWRDTHAGCGAEAVLAMAGQQLGPDGL